MRTPLKIVGIGAFVFLTACLGMASAYAIGQEHALPRHLSDGEEFALSPYALIDWGRRIFEANWTVQDGAGLHVPKATGVLSVIPRRP